jgi:hypothetical protein
MFTEDTEQQWLEATYDEGRECVSKYIVRNVLGESFATFEDATSHLHRRQSVGEESVRYRGDGFISEEECLWTAGSETTAASIDCCLAIDDDTKRLKVFLATDASGVTYRNLDDKDRVVFNSARKLELDNLFELGAYKLLTLEESRQFAREHPDSVLPSKWVDRWKATDDGSAKAKSRLVILGFKDPDVLQLERSAPTPTQEAFTCPRACLLNPYKRVAPPAAAVAILRQGGVTPPAAAEPPPHTYKSIEGSGGFTTPAAAAPPPEAYKSITVSGGVHPPAAAARGMPEGGNPYPQLLHQRGG